ncbi:protein ubiquitination [Desmophyllum pertusum]|uniref:Protein ubiquitination n=1 Tax=Desmophyllum pertusum TaxID=174260 RepID=A0A9X0CWK6_9CNID|nr:protein ubiquitination [Desmophyllum pertusum]
MLHALAVQQVTLDVEQCINELILAHEGLKDSYKSLKDYDVQVVGVCPDSGEVIAMAKLLVYTRIRQQSASCGLPVSPSPVLQSTGFIFSWNIWSGDVRILQVLQLENYPERTRYSKFNIAAKEASELRAKFFIPQSISSFVQAFSNHTVFTGKSLKYLRHPFLPLVVLL